MDVHLPVLDWQRGISRHVARLIRVSGEEEVQADRRVGVGARLELLRGGTAREAREGECGREHEHAHGVADLALRRVRHGAVARAFFAFGGVCGGAVASASAACR